MNNPEKVIREGREVLSGLNRRIFWLALVTVILILMEFPYHEIFLYGFLGVSIAAFFISLMISKTVENLERSVKK